MLLIESIKKQYDKYVVFNGVSFEIPSCSFVSLTGKNGIGKTTLLNIMAGLIDFEGNCYIDNISLKDNYTEYMSRTSYVSSHPFLYDFLSFAEMKSMIELNLIVKDNKLDKRLNKLIEELQMKKYFNTISKNLSLGTKQKAALLLGFLSNPKVVLLDEPFANLDKESFSAMVYFLEEYINDYQAIVVFATHSHYDSHLRKVITKDLKIDSENKVLVSDIV